MTESPWTEERLDKLKHFAKEGYSASQIAAALGVTRNAVIGKIHRMKLEWNSKKRAHPNRVRRARKHQGLPDRLLIPGRITPKPKPPRPVPVALKEAAIMRPIPFEELVDDLREASTTRGAGDAVFALESHHCRWPEGDPGAPDFHFCMAVREEGRSYCDAHCQIAYTTPSQRRLEAEEWAVRQAERKAA